MMFFIRIYFAGVFAFLSYITCAQSSISSYFENIRKQPDVLENFLYLMPKGGELHYHFSGGVYPEVMLNYAHKHSYCLEKKHMSLQKLSQSCNSSISHKLTPGSILYQKLLQSWSMEGFVYHQDSGHDHFFSTFSKFTPIFLDNRGVFLAAILKRAAAQQERYLEIMMLPKHIPLGKKINAPLQIRDLKSRYYQLLHDPTFLQTVIDAQGEVVHIQNQASRYLHCHEAARSRACDVKVRFIYHALREQPLANVFAQTLQAFILANQYKEWVGVNLVQAEDGNIAIRDYKKQMKIFDFLHHQYPKVHITLHAGELSPSWVAKHQHKNHIQHAIFIGHAERIGHGVGILEESNAKDLLNFMGKQQIPVEVNLTSNAEILNVKGSSQHPLLTYLKYKVPVVLSTDDEGVLRTSLTHEYVLATTEFGLTYEQLKTLSRNALTYSFLPGASIWSGRTGKYVRYCTQLDSVRCLNWIKHSEKARLQRSLEKDYQLFEASIESILKKSLNHKINTSKVTESHP